MHPNPFHAHHSILLQHPDAGVRAVAAASGPPEQRIPGSATLDEAVVRIVIAQMVSSKAALSIKTRILQEFGTAEHFLEQLEHADPAKPAHGLSAAKVRSLQSWASSERRRAGIPDGIPYAGLAPLMKDVRGFGPWSVDMLAIFQLALPDVWPLGDLVVRNTALRLWENGHPPVEPNQRTALALCCWQALRNGF